MGFNGGIVIYRVVVIYFDIESVVVVVGFIRILVGVDGNCDGIVDVIVIYNVLLFNLKFGNINGMVLGVFDVLVICIVM